MQPIRPLETAAETRRQRLFARVVEVLSLLCSLSLSLSLALGFLSHVSMGGEQIFDRSATDTAESAQRVLREILQVEEQERE